MPPDALIPIEVVYAGQETQEGIALNVPEGTRVAEAIELSGLNARYAEVDRMPVGIFGQRVTPGTVLCAGDRIEIYRPLIADPKQARRRRAARGR